MDVKNFKILLIPIPPYQILIFGKKKLIAFYGIRRHFWLRYSPRSI
jgi:hypothetical protein